MRSWLVFSCHFGTCKCFYVVCFVLFPPTSLRATQNGSGVSSILRTRNRTSVTYLHLPCSGQLVRAPLHVPTHSRFPDTLYLIWNRSPVLFPSVHFILTFVVSANLFAFSSSDVKNLNPCPNVNCLTPTRRAECLRQSQRSSRRSSRRSRTAFRARSGTSLHTTAPPPRVCLLRHSSASESDLQIHETSLPAIPRPLLISTSIPPSSPMKPYGAGEMRRTLWQ